jgi:glutamine synthetase
LREGLIFVGTCDIAGLVRGKGFPARALKERQKTGIGWTHSNLMQTCFGPIFDTPFGTGGDLMIVPDPAAEVDVDFGDGSAPEHFFLGNIRNTDGSAWECCPREFLRRGAAALGEASGLELIAAFEQEFVYTGLEDRPGHAYSLGAFRRQGLFGESLVAALRAARLTPDSFLAEYGPRQFEVTVAPAPALRAADAAVVTCELARAAAFRLGHRAIFSPMPVADGVGNGVHIHFSLHEASGAPVTYDADGPLGLSAVAAQFAAGVLAHLPAITAITAPSPVSYQRLTPNRWAPTKIDIVKQDRGAALRVCPVFAATKKKDICQGLQSRVPRLRRRRQSLFRTRRTAVCRRRRHRPQACHAAAGQYGQAAAAFACRGTRPDGAQRGGAALARACVAGGLSVTSAPSLPILPDWMRPNFAPATPRSTEGPRRNLTMPGKPLLTLGKSPGGFRRVMRLSSSLGRRGYGTITQGRHRRPDARRARRLFGRGSGRIHRLRKHLCPVHHGSVPAGCRQG